jgi:hypothetical protein
MFDIVDEPYLYLSNKVQLLQHFLDVLLQLWVLSSFDLDHLNDENDKHHMKGQMKALYRYYSND